MASTTLQSDSGNGITSADNSDDIMLNGGKLRELSIPSPESINTVDHNTFDGNWDLLSPSSSASTSSFGSPAPSVSGSLTRSRSRAMKPRRFQSSYYDQELGLWKCRNCGGTYDVPNPGSRQRREHKKACEETQRVKALQRAQEEEQARRQQAALREIRLEEATKRDEILDGTSSDTLPRNSEGPAEKVIDDPGIIGSLKTTPDIPEIEEVNFGAPNELIRKVKLEASDIKRQPENTQSAHSEAGGDNSPVQQPSRGQDGVELDEKEETTMEAPKERDRSAEQDRSAEDQSPGDTVGSSLKVEHQEGLTPLNEPRTPVSNEVHLNGGRVRRWVDEPSPSPKAKLLEKFEHVKHCSTPASEAPLLSRTLYDRLVDLHDDPQAAVARSTSLGQGFDEAARIASLNKEADEALGMTFGRSVSLDRYDVEVATRKDETARTSRLGRGVEAAAMKDHIDLSPDHLVEALVGKGKSKTASLNDGVEKPKYYNGDFRIGHSSAPASPAGASRRMLSYSPRELRRTRKQPVDQSKSDIPRTGDSRRSQSDSREEDDDLGAVVLRNVGKFWKQIAAVGAVAVIAWVGKSLADRQQQQTSRRQCRRGHFAMNSYYWDDSD